MRYFLGTLLITLGLFTSCVKTDNDPGCNVKGTWMGRWSAGTQEGSWVCNARNNGTDLGGYVFSWFDLPSLENIGISFDGFIRERQVSSKIYSSYFTLTVNGDVETDSIAQGTFKTNIGLSGTWQGNGIPLFDLSVVDSFPLDIAKPYDLDIACDAERDHLIIGNSNQVLEYSYGGVLIRSFSVDYSGNFCFDGNHLWYSDMSKNKIAEVDTLGASISEFTSPDYYNDAIMWDGENLNLISGYSRKIYTISKVGTALGELGYSYINISGFCKYGNGYIAVSNSLPGTIFTINSSGSTVVRYISTSSNPPGPPITDVKVFKLRINS